MIKKKPGPPLICKASRFLALFFLVNFSPLFLACSYQFKLVLIIAHLWCQECHLQKIVDCRTFYYVLMKDKQTLQLYDSKPDLKLNGIE